MTLGAVGHGALHSVTSQKSGKILYPGTKFCCSHASRVIRGVIKNTKNIISEDLCDRFCHASETGKEKVDGISTKKIERRAGALGCVSPRIVVVQPMFVLLAWK